MFASTTYPRFILNNLTTALADTPIVLIHGARQAGKTTLSKMLGDDYGYLTFDDETNLTAANFDPIGFVHRLPQKCILDEVQLVPEIFRPLKQAVDKDRSPGHFVLTGSTNILLLPQISESLAGRIEILRLHPLAQCEIQRVGSNLLTDLFAGKFPGNAVPLNYDDIVKRVLWGGYPEPIQRPDLARVRAWYRNYSATIIERDLMNLTSIQHPGVLPRLLRLLAIQSAQLLNISQLAPAFQLTTPTVRHYTDLLNRIFFTDILQPYHKNQVKRLVKTPKVHLTDSGLLCSILNVSDKQLLQNPTLFGHVLETFVYNEFRRHASWSAESIEFYHFRDRDGYEVDLVMEDSQGQLVAVEVKASATLKKNDFLGLHKFHRVVGDQLRLGIVMYLGEHAVSMGKNMCALPINSLWQGSDK
ncbi:MAG TPA: AAA family ATPase [Candidatus Marinimicrobia bacterium]|nr:MAG: hypothetical protein AUJ47_07670 [Candidatus Marinimicrobia bacterium CG1_02_48_14]PIZ65313.1 MAG: AAA family ATPase [Candidatus Marinimicrobia bacterium CG_4_10_14_0_2_um_filter_48_9]HCW75627.1 AAA family ATPase [Candidatus Neomarinimicrobiota bacterium]